ncbi:hypothetical protein [Dysgonomonas sp. GY617]|uniref:hypothetical protein n=1 Tax=Dysgonomonas sp. GY617 TaxID=2780420 RepID=UPI0018844737|nr:hypothetical protein [Dysgonomonas sp. GY617]MBF0575513.1 hypothetical protein [Dysgonomonas sp. GY617]
MKTIYLYFLLCSMFTLNISQVTAQIIRKEVAGQVYSIDKTQKKVINNSNTINHKNITKKCEFYTIKEPTPLDDIFKSVFSKEKIITLAKENKAITIVLFCNTSGKVVNVEFLLQKTNLSDSLTDLSSVTLSELNELEILLKKYQFELTSSCTDVKYIPLAKLCRFSKLLN